MTLSFQVGTATHLGGGAIDLSQLEPFESATLEYPVVHEKHGEKGTLTLRMLFQPESKSPFLRCDRN